MLRLLQITLPCFFRLSLIIQLDDNHFPMSSLNTWIEYNGRYFVLPATIKRLLLTSSTKDIEIKPHIRIF